MNWVWTGTIVLWNTATRNGVEAFTYYPSQSCSTTRLYQDSVLQEWWKVSSGAASAPPSQVLKPNNGAWQVRHLQPISLPQTSPLAGHDAIIDNKPSVGTMNETKADDATAPGLGTCEVSQEDESFWDRFLFRSTIHRRRRRRGTYLDAASTMHSSVLSQRNHTAKASNETRQPKHRSVLDSPLGKLPPSNSTTPRKKTRSSKETIATLLPGKKPTDVLTVADLERILKAQQTSRNLGNPSKDKTAFPQPSALEPATLQWGTTVAGGLFGTVLAASALPNLWLAGCVAGSVYGYGVDQHNTTSATTTTAIAKLCKCGGRSLARFYLKLYDAIQTVWFLFKTGQLSYDYYQRYQSLDQRFGIQRKMDAWNARFVQGKRNFDAWERENEIGRKVLATLRTAWLVEEKRGRRRSRIGQWLRQQPSAVLTALGSAAVLGVVWAVIPASVIVGLSLVLGYIWPTWLVDTIRRVRQQIAVGSFSSTDPGETTTTVSTPTISLSSRQVPSRRKTPPSKRMFQRKQFHSYIRPNGQRRYYRVGQPVWPWQRAKQLAAAKQRPPRWQVWKWWRT